MKFAFSWPPIHPFDYIVLPMLPFFRIETALFCFPADFAFRLCAIYAFGANDTELFTLRVFGFDNGG